MTPTGASGRSARPVWHRNHTPSRLFSKNAAVARQDPGADGVKRVSYRHRVTVFITPRNLLSCIFHTAPACPVTVPAPLALLMSISSAIDLPHHLLVSACHGTFTKIGSPRFASGQRRRASRLRHHYCIASAELKARTCAYLSKFSRILSNPMPECPRRTRRMGKTCSRDSAAYGSIAPPVFHTASLLLKSARVLPSHRQLVNAIVPVRGRVSNGFATVRLCKLFLHTMSPVF